MSSIVFIRNMVCPRCISAVKQVFAETNLPPKSVELGEVILEREPTDEEKDQISTSLQKQGFELLEPGKAALVSLVKATIIKQIHYNQTHLKVNFSTLLSEKLNHEYSYLSRLFSTVEGITIEKFTTAQKIERVKELLFYDEKTLSEIAYQLDYSSVAHLSAQFKKETGMTPSTFKKQKKPDRKGLDI